MTEPQTQTPELLTQTRGTGRPPRRELVPIADRALALDEAAEKYSKALTEKMSPFTSVIIMAQAMTALRELLDPRIMEEIMKLQNTALGFKTDRKEGYKVEEAKDAIIEATLRGFRVVNNEFNIISSGFYAAKNGLRRKLLEYPGLSEFKEFLGVPEIKPTGAVVKAKATWKINGALDQLERDFAIRVNAGQGADAILGKLQRKLYDAILTRLTGQSTPEREVDDLERKTETAKPVFDASFLGLSDNDGHDTGAPDNGEEFPK
jgi:hypothetical protein